MTPELEATEAAIRLAGDLLHRHIELEADLLLTRKERDDALALVDALRNRVIELQREIDWFNKVMTGDT